MKHSLKMGGFIIVLMMIIFFDLSCKTINKEIVLLRQKSVFQTLDGNMYEEKDIISLIESIVPNEYYDIFLEATECKDQYTTDLLRINLLAIGQYESGWVVLKSHFANKDGTIDVGYLMLNENNIKNISFMKTFCPKSILGKDIDYLDYVTTIDYDFNHISVYLVTCINLFKSLFEKYGCDAVYAYNAGEGRLLRNTIPNMTYNYKFVVKTILDDYIESAYSFKRKRDEALKKNLDRLEEFKRKNVNYIINKDVILKMILFYYPVLIDTYEKNNYCLLVGDMISSKDYIYYIQKYLGSKINLVLPKRINKTTGCITEDLIILSKKWFI